MIYFDNAATTCVFPEVVEAMQDAMQVTYGNPSAKHMKGIEAENKVKAAQELIAKTLRAKPKEILFTSGGTESNNTAIIGTAMANRRKGKHIITTKVEHASVYEPMYHLEEEGYEVTYLDVDSEGIVDLDQLEESIREDTILVSCMMVNNEIGAIEPIEEIAKIIGVDSLGYLSLENVVKLADSTSGFCTACFGGGYPTALPEPGGKDRFECPISEREEA